MDKTIVGFTPPNPDEPGEYALIVRAGRAAAGAESVFFIDGLTYLSDKSGKPFAIRAYRKQGEAPEAAETILEFPVGLLFVLVKRRYTRLFSTVELATLEKEETEALRGIWGDKASLTAQGEGGLPEPMAENAVLPTGQYL